jgi:hypothetical protein
MNRIGLVVNEVLHQSLMLCLIKRIKQFTIVVSLQQHPKEHFRVFLSCDHLLEADQHFPERFFGKSFHDCAYYGHHTFNRLVSEVVGVRVQRSQKLSANWSLCDLILVFFVGLAVGDLLWKQSLVNGTVVKKRLCHFHCRLI